MLVVMSNRSHLFRSIELFQNRTEEFDGNVSLDAVDQDGRTALMLAAQNGRTGLVCSLLMADADMDLRDKSGRSTLDIAQGTVGGSTALAVELVLKVRRQFMALLVTVAA